LPVVRASAPKDSWTRQRPQSGVLSSSPKALPLDH
jgi:hypothetical protein